MARAPSALERFSGVRAGRGKCFSSSRYGRHRQAVGRHMLVVCYLAADCVPGRVRRLVPKPEASQGASGSGQRDRDRAIHRDATPRLRSRAQNFPGPTGSTAGAVSHCLPGSMRVSHSGDRSEPWSASNRRPCSQMLSSCRRRPSRRSRMIAPIRKIWLRPIARPYRGATFWTTLR
jgi:hypothetical protein